MGELLGRLVDVAWRQPRRVVLWTTLPCLVLGMVGALAPRDLSFTGIMNRDDPLVAAYYRVSARLAFSARLPLLLEGPEEKLDDAAREVSDQLRRQPGVAHVLWESPVPWLKANAPWLIERVAFDAWLKLATHPDDASAPKRLADAIAAAEAEAARRRPRGLRLVMVRLDRDILDLEAGGVLFLELERLTSEILARHGVTGSFAGLAAISAQDQSRTLRSVQLLSPLSLLLVLLLFRLVERNPWRLLAVVVPMLLTVAATLGLVAILTSRITVMETFFGIMVFGLGVDFALHLMVRLDEERADGSDLRQALRRTWRRAGPGIVAGGMTTIGAFLVCSFAPDPLALHLGLSGSIGLSVCLLLMLLLLPALWTLIERRSPASPRRHAPGASHLIQRVVDLATVSPGRTLLLAAIIMSWAISVGTEFHFERDLSRIFNRQVPALRTNERVQELFGIHPTAYVVLADSLEDAREVERRFQDSPLFAGTESVARLFPADVDARVALLEAARDDITAQRKTYEGLLPLLGDQEASDLRQVSDALKLLEEAAQRGPPSVRDLPASFASEFIGPDGELVVYATPREPSLDGDRARAERIEAQRIDPRAVGFGFLLEAIVASSRPWVVPVLFGIVLVVAAVLALDLRSARLAVVAITPVLFGTLVSFGVLCAAGMSFNVLTTLVVPLLIGLGVDDGIHILHRLREESALPLAARVAATGRAIALTTGTTCASFATLLFTDHAGLEGMALVVLVGLPLCLVASVTVLPALAVMLQVAREAPLPGQRTAGE
ncbi:MAG: MMPL family transporter [Myxococcota bacterium]